MLPSTPTTDLARPSRCGHSPQQPRQAYPALPHPTRPLLPSLDPALCRHHFSAAATRVLSLRRSSVVRRRSQCLPRQPASVTRDSTAALRFARARTCAYDILRSHCFLVRLASKHHESIAANPWRPLTSAAHESPRSLCSAAVAVQSCAGHASQIHRGQSIVAGSSPVKNPSTPSPPFLSVPATTLSIQSRPLSSSPAQRSPVATHAASACRSCAFAACAVHCSLSTRLCRRRNVSPHLRPVRCCPALSTRIARISLYASPMRPLLSPHMQSPRLQAYAAPAVPS